MRVIHIIVGLNVGGAELMLQRLVSASPTARGLQHSVVSLTAIGPIGAELRKAGIEVDALGMKSVLDAPRIILALSRLFSKRQPDIVQTWMYHADLLGGLAARIVKQRKVIWGIRTTDVGAGNSRSTVAVMRLCAWLSSRIPQVIACAAVASRDAHVAVGYDPNKMVVVPNGFDLDRLVTGALKGRQVRADCAYAHEEIVVGTVGRFNAAKDHRNFVRAAGLIATRHPNARFLMVGRGLDRTNAELMGWIAETGHPSRFTLLGERSDVPACLAAMDVFCLSSRTEGFPNVVGEAMSVGLPCVVTNVGDAAFLVGNTGVVVPKENAAALADGLDEVLALAPARRAALGQQARDRIVAEFTIDRARQRFEAIYQRILNN